MSQRADQQSSHRNKPNYWPAPPIEPEFPRHDIDPHFKEIIRFLIFALFTSAVFYLAFALYVAGGQINVDPPALQLNSIEIPYMKVNGSDESLFLRCKLEFSIHNPNKNWIFKKPVGINVTLSRLNESGLVIPIISKMASSYHNTDANNDLVHRVTVEMVYDKDRKPGVFPYNDNRAFDLNKQTLNGMADDHSRGVLPFNVNMTISNKFTRVAWPHYISSKRFIYKYYCLVQPNLVQPKVCHLWRNVTKEN